MEYGLIGYPLGHSLSPVINKELFRISGLYENNFKCYEIEPGTLKEKYSFFDSLAGFNVTIPYKLDIRDYCIELHDTAKNSGAVNTVHNKIGYNTDLHGFRKSAEILGVRLNSKICVVGYGGAGRMFASESLANGAQLTIAVNRKDGADFPDGSKIVLSSELEGEFDLIINATPVGMKNHGDEGSSPVSFNKISVNFALDAIYNPSKTAFLSEAEKKGAKILNGVPMLVWQAVKSHEIWNGSVFKVEDIEKMIEDFNLKFNL